MTEKQKNAFNLGRWFVTIALLQSESDLRKNMYEGTVLKDIKAIQINPNRIYTKYRSLTDYYLRKLAKLGKASVWYDKILTGISNEITEFQSVRMTDDQIGYFFSGMDSQKTSLFTKKEDN